MAERLESLTFDGRRSWPANGAGCGSQATECRERVLKGAKAHAVRKCSREPGAVGDRVCWACGKKKHVSVNCPDKPRRLPKAIEDSASRDLQRIAARVK